MSRYIDADKIEYDSNINYHGTDYKMTSEIYINNMPTADVKPIVYGEWIEHKWAEETEDRLISNYECSICHTWENEKSYFCPCCGADMRI